MLKKGDFIEIRNIRRNKTITFLYSLKYKVVKIKHIGSERLIMEVERHKGLLPNGEFKTTLLKVKPGDKVKIGGIEYIAISGRCY